MDIVAWISAVRQGCNPSIAEQITQSNKGERSREEKSRVDHSRDEQSNEEQKTQGNT